MNQERKATKDSIPWCQRKSEGGHSSSVLILLAKHSLDSVDTNEVLSNS